ncbi:growth-regulating factor 6-like isoform X1 [Musa acuminata AAA Group]|uniref:growth-regulating factor 6 isoform X1 n=1 Tax=Musa acuminata AAA Group TaxID=214697 RepID=UPI0031D3D89E
MDFGGVVSMDGFVGASSGGGSLLSCSLTTSNAQVCRPKGLPGCGFQKLGRSAEPDDCDWRSLKMARTEAMVTAPNEAPPFLPGSTTTPHSLFPYGEQMLSFSSTSKQDALMLSCEGPLPYYCSPSASSPTPSSYLRSAGLYSGSSDVNINGVLARVRGPFTPSQWLELEHQALIYKYIVAKVAIPPNLLTPIRRSLSSSGFHPLSAGPFGSNSLGWGPFYLGYSGNADPEPGRCRRTDGKKWRCSRDAVADQKYCERHMNRGRHRSRKHVEGQSGHAAKAMPVIAASQSATAVSGAGSSSSLGSAQPQTKTLQPNVREVCTAPFNMMVMNKENANDQRQDPVSLSMLTSMNPKPTSSLFSIPEHHNAFETTSSRADLQLVATDSHLNPATRSFSDKSCIASPKLQVPRPQSHPLHHFIDDWSKTQSDRSTITWPEIEEMQFERTQLSMSIPVASSEFSSSSSPHHENLTLSPLKLSREYSLPHMDSRINVLSEVNQRQISWIPISWETSMAGPLGEALANTSSMPKDQSKNCSSSSSLNLLTDGWDSSPRMESSPTGVLQKTSFGSLTSSTGSNPRAENRKAHESTASLSDDLLGPTLVGPPTIPSL